MDNDLAELIDAADRAAKLVILASAAKDRGLVCPGLGKLLDATLNDAEARAARLVHTDVPAPE